MKKLNLIFIAALLSACNSVPVSTPSDVAVLTPVEAQPTAAPQATPTASPTPDPTSSPSPSPSPTPTVVSFAAGSQAYSLCVALTTWDSDATTIEIQYSGYFYTLSSSGATVTYTVGPFNGSTLSVSSATSIIFGGNYCTLNMNHGAVVSIVNNLQGV